MYICFRRNRRLIKILFIVMGVISAIPLLKAGVYLASAFQPVVDAGYDPVDFVVPTTSWAHLVLVVWYLLLFLPLLLGEFIIYDTYTFCRCRR